MKKKSLRTLLLLILNFMILFAVYQLFLKFESILGTVLYLAAAGALTAAYCILNRGFAKPVLNPDELPKSWTPVEKCAYIEKAKSNFEKAKKLLYWLLPIILVLGIDFIDLFLLDGFRRSLSSLS